MSVVLIRLYAVLKTIKVETIPYECWMDEIVESLFLGFLKEDLFYFF